MKQDVYEKFADKALTYINSTEAFLKEQLPDYFQQVVKYYTVQSWVFVAISLVVIVGGTALLVLSRKESQKDYNEQSEGFFMLSLIGGAMLLIIGSISFGCNLSTALKATIAPKVFIVDYLRGKE